MDLEKGSKTINFQHGGKGKMIKAVLFDLDGTLLINDVNLFMKNYFHLLKEEFKKFGDENNLLKSLNLAVEKMLRNKGPKTNYETFWDEFTKLTNLEKTQMEDFFTKFYFEKFPLIKDLSKVKPSPYAKEVIQKSFDLGLKVVIATNAVFPKIAIEERLKWAEILDFPYYLITSMEIMHSCKPNPEYYLEILEKINEKPQNTIMVGNDIEEDLVSSKVGILTFLVKDTSLSDKTLNLTNSDLVGTLKDLIEILPLLAK